MFDLIHTVARFLSGVSHTDALMSGGLGPWEENVEDHSPQKGISLVQKKLGRVSHANGSEQYEQHKLRPQSLSAVDNRLPHSPSRMDEQDRLLMPPPAARSISASTNQFGPLSSAAASSFSSAGDAKTMATGRSRNSVTQGISISEFEKLAQEHAAKFWAQAKPGFWYKSEEGLYFHLWMRGRERIMSVGWAPDFKTYPQQLFSTDSEEANLIESINLPHCHEERTHRQFHALRALRDLVELGKTVRDHQKTKLGVAKIQNTIRRAIKKYIQWALTDADLHATSGTRPTHCIVQRGRNQSVAEAVVSIASAMDERLNNLKEYFPTDAPDVHPSPPIVLKRESTSISPAPPLSPAEIWDPDAKVRDDSQGDLPPVVIGFLIVGSKVTIFTLNARNADVACESNDTTFGIHMLIKVDFSDSDNDVWNALAIALTACHLRNALLAVAKPNTDDLDARFTQGDVAGYVSKEELIEAEKMMEKKRSREEYELDEGESDEHEAKGKGKGKAAMRSNNGKRRRVADTDPDR